MPVNDLLLMLGKTIQSNWDELNKIVFNKGNIEDDILYCMKLSKDSSSSLTKILSMQNKIKSYLLRQMNSKYKETHKVFFHSSNVLINVSTSKRGSGLTFGKKKKSRIMEELEESKLSSIVNIKMKKHLKLASSILTKLSDSERKKKFKSGAIKQYVYFK